MRNAVHSHKQPTNSLAIQLSLFVRLGATMVESASSLRACWCEIANQPRLDSVYVQHTIVGRRGCTATPVLLCNSNTPGAIALI